MTLKISPHVVADSNDEYNFLHKLLQNNSLTKVCNYILFVIQKFQCFVKLLQIIP